MITQRKYDQFKESIDSLMEEYRERFSVPVITDWKEYERSYKTRMMNVARELREMVEISSNMVVEEFGRRSLLDAKEKVFFILVKEIFRLSNRRAAHLLPYSQQRKEISYKTVERLYSDPLVIMILNNMFVESIKRKGIVSVDASGDGTGYSLTVTKHYRSIREKEGEDVKRGRFIYSFALMDLGTKMYVGYSVSIRSEMDAYHKSLEMMAKMRVDLKSIRLDRYYSAQSILLDFKENTRTLLLPKKNSRVRGRKGWRNIIRRFIGSSMN